MPNPSRRHGTRSNPTKSSSLPPEELEPRLLNLDLQLPSLPSIVAGLTDTLGLTGGQQPAPAPAPSPQQPPAQPAPQPSPQQPAPQPAPSQQPAPSPQPAPPPASSTHAGSAPSNPTSSIPPNVSSSPSSSPSSGVSSNVPSASQVPGAEVTGRPPNLNLGSSGDLPDLSDHLAPAPIANAGERPDERVSASTTSLESTRTRTFVTNGSTSIVVVGPSDKPIPTDPRGSPSPNDNSSAGSSKSNHVVIAVVAVCLTLFVLIGLFFLRRRWLARRKQQRNAWWFSRKRTSKDYQDASNRQSARSSFATTFDRSLHSEFQANFTEGLPALPPMAELRRSQNVFQYPMPSPSPTVDSHRLSNGSATSQTLRFLATPTPTDERAHEATGNRSPRDTMSSWTFPYPAGHAPNSSVGCSRSQLYYTAPNSPSPSNPFADADASVEGSESYVSHTTDPFSDSCVSSSVHGVFEEVETIRRPYQRAQSDELTVQPGDQIRVLKIFDDGWAKVDKLGESADRGLIPIDCLREPGQDFHSFLEAKRVSSHVASAQFAAV